MGKALSTTLDIAFNPRHCLETLHEHMPDLYTLYIASNRTLKTQAWTLSQSPGP